MTSKSIGEVASYKPVAACGMEELAQRQKTIKPSGGVLFARNADSEGKTAARQRILELFHPDCWPERLHMLTMPGLSWRFERKLLGMREEGWMRAPAPRHTFFTSFESDRSIYYAGVAQMPGVHTPGAVVKQTMPFAFAERGIKTNYATFFFANVDDAMKADWGTAWDAAWLDYTGPMSVERLDLIADFFHRCIRSTLIITILKARWDGKTDAAIVAAGGHLRWLHRKLYGRILHAFEYYDTSPMLQLAVAHPRSRLIIREDDNGTNGSGEENAGT